MVAPNQSDLAMLWQLKKALDHDRPSSQVDTSKLFWLHILMRRAIVQGKSNSSSVKVEAATGVMICKRDSLFSICFSKHISATLEGRAFPLQITSTLRKSLTRRFNKTSCPIHSCHESAYQEIYATDMTRNGCSTSGQNYE